MITLVALLALQETVVESTVGLAPGTSGSVRVCVGGAVEELAKSDPEPAGALVRALGYSAVHLSARDLEVGEAVVRALADRIPLVSANCPLAKPYVVVRRVAITGVSAAGGAFADPAEALAKILPDLAKQADVILLLAWMDRVSTAALLRKFPSIRLAIRSGPGLFDSEPIRLGESHLVSGPSARWTVGRTVLPAGTHRIDPGPTEVSDEIAALAAKCGLGTPPLRRILEKVADREPESHAVPTRLEPGKTVVLARKIANRAVRIEVRTVLLTPEFGGRKGRFLLLDTEWENILPLALVYDRQIPTSYVVQNLGDHVYVVVNGRELSRLAGAGTAGCLSGQLKLDRVGAKVRGYLLFEAPESPAALELRYYDFAHGHATAPLLAGAADPGKPVASAENAVLEVSVFAVRRDKASGGMVAIDVDLRARSRFTTKTDATAFDPHAEKGAEVEVGTVADWLEARKRVVALVDGEFAYGPSEGTRFPEAPRFLPDVPTGGTIRFLVPEKYASLAIRCEFPKAATPSGEEIHPEPIQLPLEGKVPDPVEREAIAEIDDDHLKVAIWSHAVSGEFAGRKAAAGTKFVVLDVTATASGGEYFQSRKQLQYVTESGRQLAPHAATWAGPKRPLENVWVPAGERRSFQLVFEIPEGEKKPRVAFAGYTKAEILTLPEWK